MTGPAPTVTACRSCGAPALDTPCREFRGVRHGEGYGYPALGAQRERSPDGRLRGRRQVLLHRWVVEQVIGRALSSSEVVRHRCDNPPCFRFDHLVVGTQAENMRDMHERGNPRGGSLPGTQNPQALLSEAVIPAIRSLRGVERSADVGARYGVSGACIRDVWSGRRWRHVDM